MLYLTLDPVLALAGTARELPITIYESEVHVVDEKPTMQFAAVPYKIDSIESERMYATRAHAAQTRATASQRSTTRWPCAA